MKTTGSWAGPRSFDGMPEVPFRRANPLPPGAFHLFDSTVLLPVSWRTPTASDPVRAFNPALARSGDGWIFACRIVLPDLVRRIAIMRLDETLKVIEGSQRALSDQVVFAGIDGRSERARTWFADPRLFRLNGRLFVYWNSGWHEPENHQFIQEIDEASLRPSGPARELRLPCGRQPLEKNWGFFEDGEPCRAVYSPLPHRILRFSISGDGPVDFADDVVTSWEPGPFLQQFSDLRGGAPPQRHDGHWYSFCHAYRSEPDGLVTVAAVYRFSTASPFQVTAMPVSPLPLPNPFGARRRHEPLNPASRTCVYPCGAILDGDDWLVSYGINDEHCAIARIPHVDVTGSMREITPAP